MSAADRINVAAMVAQTEAEGPGRRFALWVQGCSLHCPQCCNPQMLEFTDKTWYPVDDLVQQIVRTEAIEGVTLLGGEPFDQAPALARLAGKLREQGLSVMVFTGYTLNYIKNKARPGWHELLASTDLLIDGPYIDKLYSSGRRWIGSSNQGIHFLTQRYHGLRDTDAGWDSGANTLELRLVNSQLTINGFPQKELDQWLSTLKTK